MKETVIFLLLALLAMDFVFVEKYKEQTREAIEVAKEAVIKMKAAQELCQ